MLVAQARLSHHHPAALLTVDRVHVQAVSNIRQLCVGGGGFVLGELACAGPAEGWNAGEGGKTHLHATAAIATRDIYLHLYDDVKDDYYE